MGLLISASTSKGIKYTQLTQLIPPEKVIALLHLVYLKWYHVMYAFYDDNSYGDGVKCGLDCHVHGNFGVWLVVMENEVLKLEIVDVGDLPLDL